MEGESSFLVNNERGLPSAFILWKGHQFFPEILQVVPQDPVHTFV